MFWLLPVIFGSLVAGGVAGAAVAAICIVVDWFLDEDTISEEIRARDEFKNSIKAIIKSKSYRKVDVGIFGAQEVELGSMELTSQKGVSDKLYVGQVIYL